VYVVVLVLIAGVAVVILLQPERSEVAHRFVESSLLERLDDRARQIGPVQQGPLHDAIACLQGSPHGLFQYCWGAQFFEQPLLFDQFRQSLDAG
jgi:hypothetical protein